MFKRNGKITQSELVVNLDIVHNNVRALKTYLRDDCRVMAVVKADAYGLGAQRIAQRLEPEVYAFAVALPEEAMALRDSGIRASIAVLSPPNPDTAPLYESFNLQPVISDLSQIACFDNPVQAHIQFNTGMHRMGIQPDDLSKAEELLSKRPWISVAGICSHMATSADPDSDMAYKQIERFESIVQQTALKQGDTLLHLGNTGGITFYPESHYDMVRPGIGLYGFAPGNTQLEGLNSAVTLRSNVVQVHAIKKGEAVSYGLTMQAPDDGWIAVVAVGYADGVKRMLSGKIQVEMNGNLYQQIGTITMDYILVFIPKNGANNEPDVEVGDAATLLTSVNGKNNHEDELSVEQWAKFCDTIPYEILTSLQPKRIIRRYE